MIKLLIHKKNFLLYNNYISSLLFHLKNFNIILIDELWDNKENEEYLYIINYIKNNLENTFIFFEYYHEILFSFLRTYYLLNIYYLNITNNKNILKYNTAKNPFYYIINYYNDNQNKLILNYQIKINLNINNKKKNIAFIKNKKNTEFNVKNKDKIKEIEILNYSILEENNIKNDNYLFDFKIIIFLEKDLHELNIIKYIYNKCIIFIDENINFNLNNINNNKDNINNKDIFQKYIIKYNNNNLISLLNEINYEKMINDISFIENIKNIYEINNNNTKYLLEFINNNNKQNINNDNFGFIILRHVNNQQTNELWKTNIKNIRKYYNNKIYIIDDNSNKDFLDEDIHYYDNCYLINSEFKKRGEILPYHYLYSKKLFKKAFIIHDGTFINQNIDFDNINQEIIYLWHFTHDWDEEKEELKMLEIINDNNLINFYKTKKWFGCFGIQSFIHIDFLNKIYKKYKFDKLLEYIDERPKRMNFERIFSVICTYENNKLYKDPSLYGIIHHYIHWGYNYENYENDIKNNNIEHLPLVKIWNGR
jgi:hypothetical protein